MNLSIFKAYDIRGVYPTDIDEAAVADIMKAIYTFFAKDLKKTNLTVVLGHDMRISSPSLMDVARKELVAMGAHVYDIGLVSTPTVYYAGLKLGTDVVIQISASHNPKEYAGIKFAKRIGESYTKISKGAGMEEVKQIAAEKQFLAPASGGRIERVQNILVQEVQDVMKEFNLDALAKKKIVADAANAMGATYITELFKQLPTMELVKMNFELDGTFPVHQADPLEAKNVADLRKKVTQEKADLGIAPDGDGDRVFFVDERGEIIPATLITSLIAREILRENNGAKILVDIRYTRNADHQIKKNGGVTLTSKVGHALITKQLNAEGAIFAGESSGHFYFKKSGGAENSLRVILYVLTVMSRESKPISEIVAELKTSFESGEYNFKVKEGGLTGKEIAQKVAEDYADGVLNTLDGVSVDYPDWRFNIRTSNTEPLLRLNIEAKSVEMTEAKLEELKSKIESHGAVPKE